MMLLCCRKQTVFCHMTPKGHNEADDQYGPVRGPDRLRNTQMVTSDPRAQREEKTVE